MTNDIIDHPGNGVVLPRRVVVARLSSSLPELDVVNVIHDRSNV